MLAVVIIYLVLGVALVLIARQNQRPKLRSIAAGLIVTWITVGLIASGSEAYFRFAYAASDTPMQWTLAGKNWIGRYMRYNSLGYRDRDWTPEELAGKRSFSRSATPSPKAGALTIPLRASPTGFKPYWAVNTQSSTLAKAARPRSTRRSS